MKKLLLLLVVFVLGYTQIQAQKTLIANMLAIVQNNPPLGRQSAAKWKDESDNIWFFGGRGDNYSVYNDLWKYNPSNNLWNLISPNLLTNSIPSARYGSATWKDANGKFILFGGADENLATKNDFWVYDPISNSWSIGYSNTPLPSARCFSATWTDVTGNLWLFGGRKDFYENDNTNLNDLWNFSYMTNSWNNVPQGILPPVRNSASTWKDVYGNFWLFGGIDKFTSLNDLWKYNPPNNLWTLMSSNNSPSLRYGSGTWTDPSGNFWLYGGRNVNTLLNDLWKFNPLTNEWINVKSNISSTFSNTRWESQCWSDNSGIFWLFGGYNGSYINTVWKINIYEQDNIFFSIP
jgi:N-acetylneuraminic acid mutarotase